MNLGNAVSYMASFSNLGDLVRRDLDLDKVAVIDLGGEVRPREFTTHNSTPARTRSRARSQAADWPAATTLRSSPSTGRNISPLISASSVQGSLRCR